jgi:hypothetical protein
MLPPFSFSIFAFGFLIQSFSRLQIKNQKSKIRNKKKMGRGAPDLSHSPAH